jgi:Zn-dependent peptidase ImmA (M78 family)
VPDEKSKLIEELRGAGISRAAIDAAWPSWWTEEAATSPSGRAELRFALARHLGLQARPLLGERVEFIWNDEARFKHLSTEGMAERSILTSYGISIARMLLRATPPGIASLPSDPSAVRQAILAGHEFVSLRALIATCWAVGIPVVHLRVFPLDAKSMHAMAVTVEGRYVVLLGRDASYPAPVAFTLAHELGHILLQHLKGASALVDLEDPATATNADAEEKDADAFALTLLTGSPEPAIETSTESFNAPTLAAAVLNAAPQHRIEPGTLALCLAYRQRKWPVAMAALKFIYSEQKPVWREINGIAESELHWDHLNDENSQYLRNLLFE